jgi:hypothetical protein
MGTIPVTKEFQSCPAISVRSSGLVLDHVSNKALESIIRNFVYFYLLENPFYVIYL